jgi:hypothetical protein
LSVRSPDSRPATCTFSTAYGRAPTSAPQIVEATNRQTLLGRGRYAPRTKGPTLDQGRLPDDRLDCLSETHQDIAAVNALAPRGNAGIGRDSCLPERFRNRAQTKREDFALFVQLTDS